jgi:hypothetical protein
MNSGTKRSGRNEKYSSVLKVLNSNQPKRIACVYREEEEEKKRPTAKCNYEENQINIERNES